MLRQLILGQSPRQSLKIYKQAMLRGLLALIIIVTGTVYVFIDLFFEVNRVIPVYIFIVMAGIAAFWFNRNQHYLASTLVILISGNFVIYLLASSEPSSSGVFVFFVPAALGGMALLSYTNWYWGLGMILLSFLLFIIAYSIDFSLLPKSDNLIYYNEVYFKINFTIALTASVLIVYFLININYNSEKILKENELKLTNTADELKTSRERFELAVQGTQAGIYEWRVKENSVYVSPIWKKMLGYDPDEAIEMSIERLVEMTHPDDLERTQQSINQHLATGKPYHNELRLRTKDGLYKWFYDSGVGKINFNKELETVIGSLIDIDERKKAEQQIIEQNELLAKANAELDRFVYSVSHDLRAPLSSVKGLIGIAEKSEDYQELKSYLSMMRGRIDALEKFIRDIIDYSRNSRLEVVHEPVNLHELVHEIMESLRFTDEHNVVSFKEELSKDFIILSDKVRLKIILNNLLSNALKYHDPEKNDSVVSIQANHSNELLHILVEDNGLGIDSDQLPKIFDMFYRASVNSTGSGLGLYIARETIKKLNGKITAESTPGVGTRFILEIPTGG
ncbi:MAG: PAS domain-containing sensor histidine kinase [Cyclobacteriaceae bacterium]|nr:PAS domain-containing sensor histidine kinase [Cyclobacteriaceae bacterium]